MVSLVLIHSTSITEERLTSHSAVLTRVEKQSPLGQELSMYTKVTFHRDDGDSVKKEL